MIIMIHANQVKLTMHAMLAMLTITAINNEIGVDNDMR